MHVGVEVGGTFTDLIGIHEGKLIVKKVRSTPKSPEIGALNALDACGAKLSDVSELAHGSTVATNAVLERRGTPVAFVTTKGFRDILFLQRQARRTIFDLDYANPKPITERCDCFEVSERVGPQGKIESPLDINDVAKRLIPTIRKRKYGVVAVCLLNSYANPEHELRLAKEIRDAIPEVRVTVSNDVTRQFREYERASTTAISAYVQPVVDQYLSRFQQELEKRGFNGAFSVMQSNGGRMVADAMRRNSVTALFSGPAAGVMGATYQVGKSAVKDLITFDMGGTSTDVCLVDAGVPTLTSSTEIDGLPLLTPVLDIVTVGGGGGSIVWIDEGGVVRVGPQSAGADPGPACYGFGGERPTITDAQLLTGALRAENFGQGTINLDRKAAERAFSSIAKHLGVSVEDAAASAIKLVNAVIVRAIQQVSTARGRDPRDYSLVPFGGAGPLHAAEIAAELGIAEVVVPPRAGVISAFGLVTSGYRLYATVTKRLDVDLAGDEIVQTFSRLRTELRERFQELGRDPSLLSYEYVLEMRYKGQAFEIATPFSGDELSAMSASLLRKKFAYEHNRALNHAGRPDAPIEIINFRVGAQTSPPENVSLIEAATSERENLSTSSALYIDGSWRECRFLFESGFLQDIDVSGPAIVEGDTCTTFVPNSWVARRDANFNIALRRK